ncbi:MAG TPA: tetratricopeptide repeat protein [Bryobacteraceae bacterium]|nr:tetratricopeptide repeat protein [Bryobacteraceae bacterium]
MMKLFAGFSVLVLAVAAAAGSESPAQTRRVSAGLAGKTTDERIAYYSKAVTQTRDTHLTVLLAMEYLQKMRETGDGRYLKLAQENVEGAIKADGDNLEAQRFRNEIGLQLHDFRRVAQSAESLVARNPSDTGSWGNLGDARMELGRYQKAAEAYHKMLSLRPNLASYNRAAYFHFVTGNAPTAIALMQDAIRAGSRTPEQLAWCWAELGDMYFKTGSLEQARFSYLSALKLQPSLHRAHAGMGRWYAGQGKLEGAIESFQRAQAIVPLPEYIAALEDLYTETGQPKKAKDQLQLLEAASMLAADKANRVLAVIHADHDRKLPAALQLVQDEYENRDDVYTHDALAWVLCKLQRYGEAELAAQKALQFGTPEPAFYFHAGMIAAALHKSEEARKHLTKALASKGALDRRQSVLAAGTLAALR